MLKLNVFLSFKIIFNKVNCVKVSNYTFVHQQHKVCYNHLTLAHLQKLQSEISKLLGKNYSNKLIIKSLKK